MVLGYIRSKSEIVADIISPILTKRNLKILVHDEWFKVWLKEQELHKKALKKIKEIKEIKEKLFHNKKKGRVNTVNMKVS